MQIRIDEDSKVLLAKYVARLSAEFDFKVELEQGLNRLIKITLGEGNGNTD